MIVRRDILGDVLTVIGGLMFAAAVGQLSHVLAVAVLGVMLIAYGILLNRPAA